jgi:hypothetical protein
MSNFYQTGVVATFHRLDQINLDKIEEELSWYAVWRVSTFPMEFLEIAKIFA